MLSLGTALLNLLHGVIDSFGVRCKMEQLFCNCLDNPYEKEKI
jgi:hypothetical protein